MTASEPPPPRSTMWRAAARSVKKTPSRLTRSTRRHSSVVMSTNGIEPADPGVGEARVDAAEPGERRRERALDRGLVADVARRVP